MASQLMCKSVQAFFFLNSYFLVFFNQLKDITIQLVLISTISTKKQCSNQVYEHNSLKYSYDVTNESTPTMDANESNEFNTCPTHVSKEHFDVNFLNLL